MSDTITPEEIAAKLVGEMDFGDRDLRACISTAIREAEARGEARERGAIGRWVDDNCEPDEDIDSLLIFIASRSRRPIEGSETDGMVEGHNGT